MNSTSMDEFVKYLEKDFLSIHLRSLPPNLRGDLEKNVYKINQLDKITNNIDIRNEVVENTEDFTKICPDINYLDQPESGSSETFLFLKDEESFKALSFFGQLNELRGLSFMEKINDLRQKYIFKNEDKIIKFLFDNLNLIDLLDKANLHLNNIFEKNKNLILSYITYPEENYKDKLYVQIVTNLNPSEALDKLDEFDKKWFLDQVIECEGKLNFDVKIVEE